MNHLGLSRGLAALAFTLGAVAPSMAQDQYPSRPIRIIVPVPAGGAMDITTRLVAEKMREKLGNQQIIVENRPGGDERARGNRSRS